VVRMDQRHEDLLAGTVIGSKVPRPKSMVVGTGFLVRTKFVVTNRHVIEAIASDHREFGHHQNWYLEFTYPQLADAGWTQTFKRVNNILAIVDPTGGGAIDAGLLQFDTSGETDAGFDRCTPVVFGELREVVVGTDIAVCGFPLGNELLIGAGLWRFGPVIHEGIISGVAPFDITDPRLLTAFVTDLNSAGGMSGSPVFTPIEGRVIGLHYAGAPGTVGCAVPIDQTRIDSWIRFYERVFVHGERPTLTITGGGDIVND
jgi:S1-C subfamily serine protease